MVTDRGFFYFTILQDDAVNRTLTRIGIAPTVTLARLLAGTVFDFSFGRNGVRIGFWRP